MNQLRAFFKGNSSSPDWPWHLLVFASAPGAPVTFTIQAAEAGNPISSDQFGIVFEDLNYAADGGLYADLIQNRSFEYSPAEQSPESDFILGTAETWWGRRTVCLARAAARPAQPHAVASRPDLLHGHRGVSHGELPRAKLFGQNSGDVLSADDGGDHEPGSEVCRFNGAGFQIGRPHL